MTNSKPDKNAPLILDDDLSFGVFFENLVVQKTSVTEDSFLAGAAVIKKFNPEDAKCALFLRSPDILIVKKFEVLTYY